MAQRVLVDANVIASRTLTDWLFHLRRSNGGMYSVLWTRDIQAEAIRVMRNRHPEWPGNAIDKRLEMLEDVIDEMITFPKTEYHFTGADRGIFTSMQQRSLAERTISLPTTSPRTSRQHPLKSITKSIAATTFLTSSRIRTSLPFTQRRRHSSIITLGPE